MTCCCRADDSIWESQLEKLYPEEPDAESRINSYLKEILARSLSPVAAILWRPKDGDLAEVICGGKVKKYNYKCVDIPEKRRDCRAKKTGGFGHTALLWRSANGELRHFSFWPQKKVRSGEAPGQFLPFAEDLKNLGQLPDVLLVNLSEKNGVTFGGRLIKTWNVAALDRAVDSLEADPPIFHLKARDGGENCSSSALKVLQQGCITVEAFHSTIDLWSQVERSFVSDEVSTGEFVRDLLTVMCATPLLAAFEASDEILHASYNATQHFRSHSITPNLVSSFFGRQLEYFQFPGPKTTVEGAEIKTIDKVTCGRGLAGWLSRTCRGIPD